jgi:hypothetical protein
VFPIGRVPTDQENFWLRIFVSHDGEKLDGRE